MVEKIVNYEDGNILEWKWASDHDLIPNPFFTSLFFVDGILIDAGPPAGADDFREFIKSLLETSEIKLCMITHSHEDHCGGAYILQQEFNIPIFAPKDALDDLKKEYTYPKYRKITWGQKRLPVEAMEVPDIITSNSGEYTFQVFPMPGHAPEQIALIEKDKQWLFVADGIQPKYKMLFGAASDIQEDISVIYQSLKNLYKFTQGMNDLKIFLSGPGLYEGRDFIKEKLDEINKLHKQVHKIYEEESKNYDQEDKVLRKVLKRMFKRETVIGKLTEGDLSTANLIKSLFDWSLDEV